MAPPQREGAAPRRAPPEVLTFVYVAMAVSWLVATDVLAHWMRDSAGHSGSRLAAVWGFVVLSGVVFGLVLYRQLSGMRRRARALTETNAALRSIVEVTVPAVGWFNLDELLDEMLGRLCRSLGATLGVIFLVGEGGKGLEARATRTSEDLAGNAVTPGRPLAAEVVDSGQRSVVDLVSGRAADLQDLPAAVSSAVAVPMTGQEGNIGVLLIGAPQVRRFGPSEIGLVELVAERAAAAVERTGLVERERRARLGAEHARLHMGVLAQASDALAGALDSYDAALADLVDQVVPTFADWFGVDLADDPGGGLRAVASGHADPLESQRLDTVRAEFPAWEVFLRQVMATGQSWLAFSRVAGEPVGSAEDPVGFMMRMDAASFAVVPVRVRGLSFGTLSLATGTGRRGYRRSDLAVAEGLAQRVAVAIERVLLYQEAHDAERASRRQATYLRRLMQASLSVSAPLSETDVLHVVAEQARIVTGAGRGIVAVGDESERRWAASPGHPSAGTDLPEAGLHRFVARTNRSARSGALEDLPWEAVDGERAPRTAWLAAPLTGASGANVGSVVVTRSDQDFGGDEESVLISLAQMASVALENARLYQAVHESELRLQALIDSTPLAIVEMSLDGRVRRWNKTAEELFGWSADLPAEHAMPTVTASDDGHLMELWRQAVDGQAVVAVDGNVRRHDGSTLEVSVSTAPLRGAEDQVIGVLAVVEDVTARRQMEEQLNRAERMDAMGRLAGAVAHDFNNLLTVIMGYNEVMGRRLEDASPLRADLDAVKDAVQRAADLTSQLLDIGRQQVYPPVPTDVSQRLKVLEPVLARLLNADTELRLELADLPTDVVVDPGRLERVIINLVINAADAMPTGGCLTVTTRAVEVTGDDASTAAPAPGSYIELCVSDSGVGMDEHTLEHCLDPFFTTKDRTKGTGLGLAAVYGIVTQSEGHISVASQVGVGTTVRILLPAVPRGAGGGEVEPGSFAPKSRGNERVLLVEDEEDVRRLARDELERQGYSVVDAADGQSALFIADEEGPFDLLVTDVVMPELTGPELARRVATLWPSMPVLFISGHIDAAQRRILEPDADLLHKPFPPHVLVERVRQALDRARAPQA